MWLWKKRAYALCLLFSLYIISGARTVSADMKGIPRTDENLICSAVGAEKPSPAKVKAAATVLLTVEPTATTSVPSTAEKPPSLNSDLLLEMINNHRSTIGKPAYQKEDKLCSLAQERGPELYDEVFNTGNVHGGLYARNLPYWITENMKHGPNESDVFNWWMGSSIHRKAIEGDFTYSCGECYGNTCAQLFTSYQPK